MYSIILCGGSGTRLWPLSRKNFPKQFLKLYSDYSLLQETFLRMQKIMPSKNIFLVTNQENFFNVFNQIREIFPRISKQQIIAEPASMNTAPAIALGIKYLTEKMGVKKNVPIIILPSDHYIGKPKAYLKLVKSAMKNLGNNIGTIGITPTSPETGFGYIKKGKKIKTYSVADAFKEKPDRKTAQGYLASKQYVWNGGMYLFNAKTFSSELQKHAPKLFSEYEKSFESLVKNFQKLQKEPIDTAISEKSKKIIIFEGDFGWSDIGSFDVLSEIAAKNNRISTKHVSIDSKNVYAHSETGKMIATLGVDDVVVIESRDVIFVQKKGRSEDVRKIVDYLKDHKCREVEHNMIVYRPWGKYEILIEEKNHKVKKVTVYPGESLNLHSHKHRAEHWVVAKGVASIINGGKHLLHENESTFIPVNTKHKLSNFGKINLEIVEVQTGKYLEEDDVVHYEDDYGHK